MPYGHAQPIDHAAAKLFDAYWYNPYTGRRHKYNISAGPVSSARIRTMIQEPGDCLNVRLAVPQ